MSGHGTWSGQSTRRKRKKEGGTGGGGGESLSAISDRMYKEHGMNIDYRAIESGGYNADTVKDGIKGAEWMYQQLPKLNNSVSLMSTDSEDNAAAYLSARFGDEQFKLNICGIFRDNQDTFNSKMNAGYHFHPDNQTAASVIAHEMGHAAEYTIANNKYGAGTYSAFAAMRDGTESKRILKEASKALKLRGYKKPMAEISGYARTDTSEALAEACADVYANGSNAHPYSRQIWKILQRELG